MRHIFFIAALCLILSACSADSSLPATPSTAPQQTASVVTEPPTAAATVPQHSNLYIAGVPVEDVIGYFNEVVLNAEFINSGNPAYLQRWDEPIFYILSGTPTDEDLTTLSSFSEWLNTIDGFPGIHETDAAESANLSIYFCTESELISHLGDNFYGTDGGVTFWYMDNKIYKGIICCRTDLDQQLRNSVILEELYNGLGPIQDTELRPDSIVYSGFSQPQQLTPMDELILKLLYHPQMQCGMDADACEGIIRQLYY